MPSGLSWHMLGGFPLTRIGYAGLRKQSSRTRKRSLGAAYAALFQLQIEIFDGQFEKYGFSYAIRFQNTAGQAGCGAGAATRNGGRSSRRFPITRRKRSRTPRTRQKH